jgi:hypothetical protein
VVKKPEINVQSENKPFKILANQINNNESKQDFVSSNLEE